jgi:hypothetical protein
MMSREQAMRQWTAAGYTGNIDQQNKIWAQYQAQFQPQTIDVEGGKLSWSPQNPSAQTFYPTAKFSVEKGYGGVEQQVQDVYDIRNRQWTRGSRSRAPRAPRPATSFEVRVKVCEGCERGGCRMPYGQAAPTRSRRCSTDKTALRPSSRRTR